MGIDDTRQPALESASTAPDETQRADPSFAVVGIGASAGGIEALRELFEHVPVDSGIAYVVILHLSPDHDSQLAQILQTTAPIPVTQVTERVRVAPNHVYVVPPSQHLLMIDGHLAVLPNISVEERRVPVDLFFRRLAESHQTRAIAVVLSGAGANGSMGLKRVKERGGAVFVQDPHDAAFSEMPRNAIATGFVDEVLPAAAIPARIVAYCATLKAIAISPEAEQRSEDQQGALREIFALLRLRTGHDFSNYKRATLLRRIERRIIIRNLPDLPTYAASLRNNPDEIQALLKDLLISVTNFFRNREAFEAIEHDILPRIFRGKTAGDEVRVWVVGCATGEEAYSLAMLLADLTAGALDAPKVQIFATDIDEAALARAREGLYTLNDAVDVSPERLLRFFTKEGDRYRVQRDIRAMVLFANHNAIKDPPFSHLDLVSCRNVLIYLNRTAQERLMETLHFALNPGGYLFLGSSESPDGAVDLYAVANREQHIFQSRQTGTLSYPVSDLVPTPRPQPARVPPVLYEQQGRALERVSYSDLHQRLLEQYAPPSLVVNEAYDIVHLSERAGRYLQFAGGEPSNNLLKLIRPELRLELHTALSQAVQRQTNVDASNLAFRINKHIETVTIRVRPVLREGDPARGFLLVLFEPSSEQPSDTEMVFWSDQSVAQQLEEELIRVKAQLRTSDEQHEIQAEELKASNEELQAMNEELRSTAEELETSKEELQSINEELRTVNQELKIRIEQTTQASNNLQNLVNSTNIGTIFLDRSLHIALFTPAAGDLFNLISADYYRPLSDITNRLANIDVIADAEAVLNTLQPIEREVHTVDDKRMFLMRVLPYRTAEDRINGVVLTFVDITERKRAEEGLRESQERLQLTLQATNTGTFLYHIKEDRGEPDARMLALFGLPEGGKLNLAEALSKLIHPDDRARYAEDVARANDPAGDGMLHSDIRVLQPDGGVRWISVIAQVMFEGEQRRATLMYGVAADISERKRAEERQAFLLHLSDALRSLSDAVDVQATVTRTAMNFFGADRCYYCEISDGNAIIRRDAAREGLPSVAGVYPLDSFAILKAVVDAGRPFVVEDVHTTNTVDEELRRLCIGLHVISYVNVPIVKKGKPVGVLCLVQSTPRAWTELEVELARETAERTWAAVERARAEEALAKSEAKYRTLFDSIDEGFCIIEVIFDANGKTFDLLHLEANEAYERYTGLRNIVGKRAREIVPDGGPWLDFYGNVALTGEPARLEAYVPPGVDRWISSYASRVGGEGSRKVAVVFDDITERKRAEAHQALLIAIGDDLSHLVTPDEIMQAVGARLGEYLNLGVCVFVDVDEERGEVTVHHGWNREGVTSLEQQTFRMSDYATEEFQRASRAKELFIIRDTATDERVDGEAYARLNVGAWLSVPFHREGLWTAFLSVTDTAPRDWRDDEIELVRNIADRVFPRIERARAEEALHESEAQYRLFTTAVSDVLYNMSADWREMHALEGKGFLADTTNPSLSWLERYIPDSDKAFVQAAIAEAIRTKTTFELEHRVVRADGTVGWAFSRAVPLLDERGDIVEWFGAASDTTERKEAAQRQAYLLKLSDALRPLGDATAIERVATRILGEALGTNRVFFASIEADGDTGVIRSDYVDGIPSGVGRYSISAFAKGLVSEWRLGRTTVTPDVNADPRFTDAQRAAYASVSAQASVGVPLVKGGRLVAILGLNHSTPRAWTDAEVALTEETAERIWAIAERARAEIAVRESENRLQRMVNVPHVGVLTFDFGGSLLSSNEAFLAMVGYSRDEFAARPWTWQEFTPQEHVEASLGVMEMLRTTGMGGPYEKEYFRKDGSRVWMMFVAADLGDGTIVEYAIDISDRKRAETALREADERFRTMADNAPVLIWETDASGIIFVNGHYLDFFGVPFEDVRGMGWATFLHPDDVNGYLTTYQHAFEQREPFTYECRLRRADGEYRWFITTGRPLNHDHFVGFSADITDNKRAEEALRVSEERMRLATEAAQMYSWEFDVSSETYRFSANAPTILGIGPDALPRTVADTLEIVHPDDRELITHALQQALDTGEGFTVDIRSITQTGEAVWLSVQSTVIQDAWGKPTRIIGIAQDTSERKRADEAIRASEVRFRTLADAVPQVIWGNEAGGKANYFNQRWFTYSGLSLEESIGPGWQAIVHPDDAPASVERWQQALAAGTVFDTEYRLRRHDGVYRWFIGRNVPLRDDEQRVIGWFGSATDIHDLKEAEAAVRESSERLYIAIEAAEMGTWDWNVHMDEVYWNERHFLLFGMQPTTEPVRPEDFFAHVHPDDRDWVGERLQQSVNEKTVFEAEFRAVLEDGSVRWMSGYGQAVEITDGTTTRMSGVMLDITERKQAEAVLQHTNEILEARVQERTAELQRLTTIRQDLLRQLVSAQEEERRRISRELHDQMGQSISALRLGLATLAATPSDAITHLQAIAAQIDADVDRLALELRPSVLDGVGLVAAVEQHIAEWSQWQQIAADFEVVGPDGNRLAPEVEVVLYRVVQEALTNVFKHANATQVSVVLEQRHDQLGLVIEDNGSGFDVDALQARTANDRGLGLLGMQERVTQVGGTLTIESAPGEGTTLYVRVPLPPASEARDG